MLDRCWLGCCIQLSKGFVAYVDPEDWVRLHKLYWRAKKSKTKWYAIRHEKHKGKTKYIYMHREITACPLGMEVHHRNGNTLDNRTENLEIMSVPDHRFITRAAKIRVIKPQKKNVYPRDTYETV